MKTNSREIQIYYHPESNSDKQTIAHAKGMSKHVKTFAFSKSPSTDMSWQQILNSLDLHPKELLNKAHPKYQATLRGNEYNREGWLHILQNNTDLIKAPIAMRGNRAVLCLSPTDVYKLDT